MTLHLADKMQKDELFVQNHY